MARQYVQENFTKPIDRMDDVDRFEEDMDEMYPRTGTDGDYGPSTPWNAPGMSIRDFI